MVVDQPEVGSQTLARGLLALALIGESETPFTTPELAARLGVHRSMAYRLVRTLEQHGFIERAANGELEIGTRLAGIARHAVRDLQSIASPVLAEVANEFDVTAFLVGYDGEAAVTLVSAEPRGAGAPVGQRPGTRHPVDRGAPGRVIRSLIDPVGYPAARHEISHGEVFDGLASVAVPLRTPQGRPMSIAVLYLTTRIIDADRIVDRLEVAAAEIARSLH